MASIHHNDDELQLQALGHKGELQRNFSLISMLGLAFAILNSWTALSSSLSLALPSGGSTSVIWGLLTAGICNLALAASLAEFLSAYPTAGGQYHWVAVITPKRWVPLASWITGWINVSGWIALTTSGGLLASQLIAGVISLFHPDFTIKPWQQYLIYVAWTLIAFLVNAFLNRLLPYVNRGAFIWSIGGFAIICITVLACSAPNYASADFVFTEFINETGWPDGISWLLGLLQGGFGITGYDAVAHMIEEIPNASVEGPKIMIYCVCIGTVTGFIFLMILLFVSGGDANAIIESTSGPLVHIIYTATNNRAGAVCLLMFPLICILFAEIAIMTTSSRMSYAFARDGGLPASKFFAKVDKRLDVPLNALILAAGLTLLFGLIMIGSSSAFNALIAASVVALGVSYAIPVAINVCRGRKMLPARAFTLPNWLGWVANLVGLAYAIVTTVLFVFPPELPVTGSNMNYCIVAFGIILLVSTIQWFVDGRKNFTGPRAEMSVEVLEAMKTNESATPAYTDPKLDGEVANDSLLSLQYPTYIMPLNPWRLVKELWHRPHPTSVPMIEDDIDDTKIRVETPSATSPPSPFPLPLDNGLEESSTETSSPGVSGIYPADQFLDDVAESAPLKETGSPGIEDNARRHTRCTSDASTITLQHNSIADSHEDQDFVDDNKEEASHGGVNEKNAGATETVESGKEEDDHDRDFQTHTNKNVDERCKLVPKRQQDRLPGPASSTSKRDFASEIAIEKATDTHPLPEGYLGTWRGFQFFSPSLYHNGSCGTEAGLHRLTCGHWVESSGPCGVNCKSSVYKNEAFICGRCRDDVKNVLDHELSADEREKLGHAREGYHVFYVALVVELVIKHKTMKANVTETVMGVLDGYGRTSVPSRGPKEPESVSFEETIREIQLLHEQKEFEAKNPLVRHEKRVHTETDQSEPEVDEARPASRHKHNHRVDDHNLRTNDFIHSTKRKAVDAGADADADAPRSRTKKVATAAEAVLLQSSSRVDHGDLKRDLEDDDGTTKENVAKRSRFSNDVDDDRRGS
ncbi:hypothetical protein N0V95_009125 [Ascochyta clinopodiicola]|nr:hypothetical protein N0V95_009125 [Ascochyta clinopodiicola]